MTVIDAHQHLWDLARTEYAWITPELSHLDRTFTEVDAAPELAAAGVDRTVLVQAAGSAEDTAFMVEVADRWAAVVGIVGWLPLLDPDHTAAELDRWAGDPRLVGVRHLIHDEPDPDWLLQPAVLTSLALVAEHGLAYDVVAELPRHLELVPMVAERCPGLRLVVDHLAKPDIAGGAWQPWADLLTAAAALPQVTAKISGLTTAADPTDWTPAVLQPYVDHALDVFGSGRLMMGSDWPVSTSSGGYADVWHGTVATLGGLTADQRADVLGGTAERVYRLAL